MLDLSSNQLTGDTSDLGPYPHLVVAKLWGNSFHGHLSKTWASSVNLTTLDVSGNMINGSLPPEFSNLVKLEVLALQVNNLTGDILPGAQDC